MAGGEFDQQYYSSSNCFRFITELHHYLSDRHIHPAPHLRCHQCRIKPPCSPRRLFREETALKLYHPHRQPGDRRFHGFHHSNASVDHHHSGRLLAVRAGYVRYMVCGRLQFHAGFGLRPGRHLHRSPLGNEMVSPLPQTQHQEESDDYVRICLVSRSSRLLV